MKKTDKPGPNISSVLIADLLKEDPQTWRNPIKNVALVYWTSDSDQDGIMGTICTLISVTNNQRIRQMKQRLLNQFRYQ